MRVAIALPNPYGERLTTEAIRHGHEVVLTSNGTEELVDAFGATRPELAIVHSRPTALTRELLSHCDQRGIRLLAAYSTDSDRRHAAEVGVFELIALDAPWQDFEAGLLSRLKPAGVIDSPPRLEASADRRVEAPAVPAQLPDPPIRPHSFAPRKSGGEFPAGKVIAVWGAAGAPGRTTVAISVAAELASRGYSVALCDADTYSASIAPTLGILDEAPGFAAACRLAGNDSLNRAELERIGSRYGNAATGFWVLTGIGSPSRWPELSMKRVEATIAESRKWVDFTVIDTGFSLESDEELSSDFLAPRRNAATLATLGAADSVLAVGSADPVGLSRFLRGYSELVELCGTERVTVVMNKLRASAIGLNPVGQVQQTLARFGGIRDAVLIPADQIALDSALLAGRTLHEVAPKSAVLSAIAQLVTTRILSDR